MSKTNWVVFIILHNYLKWIRIIKFNQKPCQIEELLINKIKDVLKYIQKIQNNEVNKFVRKWWDNTKKLDR